MGTLWVGGGGFSCHKIFGNGIFFNPHLLVLTDFDAVAVEKAIGDRQGEKGVGNRLV